MNTGRPSGKIITFYSYKGGTGRSMALANVAWVLASAGKSVLVIDWDLEAPGLHRYFRPFLIDKELTSSDGLIDFIIHYADTAVAKPPPDSKPTPANWFVEYADITEYALSLNFGEFPPGGRIDFVPAGRQGATYATRVNTFDWQKFYTRLGGETFLEVAKDFMRKYDYVLIDSRTGVSDTSGICTVQMPDTLVVCFTLNNQSIEGTAAVAQSSAKERAEFIRKRKERNDDHVPSPEESEFRILPIPMRAELNEKERLDRRRKFAKRRFNTFLSHIPAQGREAYWGGVQVPYIPYYAFEELLSPFIDNPADRLSVLQSMVQISGYLTDSEVNKFDLIITGKKKDEVLNQFALVPDEEVPSAAAKAVPSDTALARQIEQADEFFSQLTGDEKETARRLWTRLVRVPREDERTLNSAVIVPLDDLDPAAEHLARTMAETKLLVIDKDVNSGKATVAANENLLRRWPQLVKWIEEDREFLIWRQKLRENVGQWERNGRSRFSLLSGRSAGRASARLRERPADLSLAEREYIEKSARHLSYILGAAVAAAAALVVLVGLLFYNARQARAQTAQQLRLAVQGFNVNDPKADLDLGMLIALESLNASGDPAAQTFLRDNLVRYPVKVAVLRHDAMVDSVTFGDDSTRLTTVSGRFADPPDSAGGHAVKMAQVWDVFSGQAVTSQSLNAAADDFAVSSDGRYVAVVGTERDESAKAFSVLLYDLNAPSEQPAAVNVHSDVISTLAFSPRSAAESPTLLASGSENGEVRVLDVSGAMKPKVFKHNSSTVISLAFGSARYIITGTSDDKINTWDLNGNATRSGSLTLPDSILSVASSDDDKYLAAVLVKSSSAKEKASRAREALLLAQPINNTNIIPLGVADITFSPDSRYVAASGEDGTGHVFSLADGTAQEVAALSQGVNINKIIFSDDGKYVVTAGLDNVVRIWEVGTAREFARLILSDKVNDLAFSPDGRYIAVASSDKTAHVWRVADPGDDDAASEACKRLSRNLTPQEWSRYFGEQPYRKTCQNLP